MREVIIVKRIGVLLTFALAVGAQDPDQNASQLRPVIQRYTADLRDIERTYPINASEARVGRLRDFLSDQQAQLDRIDFNKLSQDGRIDYLLLRSHIDVSEAKSGMKFVRLRKSLR